MTVELAHLLAFLALGAGIGQTVLGLLGRRRIAGQLAVGAAAALVVSFVLLCAVFVSSDFSVGLVLANSHTAKPLIYKIAGTWGNHEGSMLLWCVVAAGYGAAGALLLRTGRPVFEARALGVQGLVLTASLLYLLFASSPFLRVTDPPLQGFGLNPLLQDPALAFHPPLLYLGYVGYSFVFALAAAGLWERRIDRHWAKAARGWSLAAFAPLTGGIALGSYWAYYELGWGGWWFWDPVENASLMPWLAGAALLHSLAVTEKRGSFAAWSALLATLCFVFSLLGTFLVRSGLLTSVHAFAVDPERGTLLLFGLLFFGGGALGLFALRAPKLAPGQPFLLKSREGALMANNFALVVAAAVVMIGTFFPLAAEAAGRTMSVGEPYFNATVTPVLGLVLVLLPAVQAWSWGRAEGRGWLYALLALAALFAVLALLGLGPLDLPLGAAFGVALGIYLMGGALWELGRRAKRWTRLPQLPARSWGMTLAHFGLGLFVLGAVIETSQRYETSLALPVGGQAEAAGWTWTLDRVASLEGPNWYADQATLRATRDGQTALLSPQKRYYPAAAMPTTETDIFKTGTGDLYAALGDLRPDPEGGPGRYVFRVYFNPLVDAVFIGAFLVTLGAFLSLFGSYRMARP